MSNSYLIQNCAITNWTNLQFRINMETENWVCLFVLLQIMRASSVRISRDVTYVTSSLIVREFARMIWENTVHITNPLQLGKANALYFVVCEFGGMLIKFSFLLTPERGKRNGMTTCATNSQHLKIKSSYLTYKIRLLGKYLTWKGVSFYACVNGQRWRNMLQVLTLYEVGLTLWLPDGIWFFQHVYFPCVCRYRDSQRCGSKTKQNHVILIFPSQNDFHYPFVVSRSKLMNKQSSSPWSNYFPPNTLDITWYLVIVFDTTVYEQTLWSSLWFN